MDRLTYKGERDWEIKGADGTPCDEVCEGRGLAGCGNCPIQNVIDRLAAYEDTGLEPEEIMGLCSMHERAKMAELLRMEENRPLTLEELREMDGEPVRVTEPDKILPPFWGLVDARNGTVSGVIYCATFEDYGAEWLAYRRKPEEGET